MRALFDDGTRQDEIGVLDRRKAVRHDEAGAPLHELRKGVLHAHFGAGIDGARRLVQDEHGRTGEHDARDAEQLPLPLRERALVADDGIVSFGQAGDEAVRVASIISSSVASGLPIRRFSRTVAFFSHVSCNTMP